MTQPNNRFHSFVNRFLSAALSGSVLTITAAATTAVVNPYVNARAEAALQTSPKAVLDEAWQIVNREYVDSQFNHVDWQQVRTSLLSRSYTNPQEAYTALRLELKKLNDPYTRFLDPKEFQALNSQDINGELTGVGLQLKLDQSTQKLTVVKAIEKSPALRAGVQAGDTILQINGRSTKGMTVEAASQLIRGPENTKVRLVLARTNQTPFELAITRARIEVPTVYSALRTEGYRRVGYIRLSEFSGHAADQMRRAIADLTRQKVDGFVLDLRGNPGGRLDQEVLINRMLLNNGTIVRTVDRNGVSQKIETNGTALTNQPIAVLVDGNSASASEILTGSLKDNKRAVVVGTQTFGKALVQSVNPLSDGSGLNVTVARYFTPAGIDINHKGITPDVVVSLSKEKQQQLSNHPDDIGTTKDPQYSQALANLGKTASVSRSTLR